MSRFQPDTIRQGDCIEILRSLAAEHGPVADLVFADPPFNIGYTYDVYEDRKAYDEYYQWTADWMAACQAVCKPAGSFWIAIGDEYAAEVKIIARDLGLHLRNWVIWHYTFGQATKKKFARSHAHLFYFVMDPRRFTFNDDAIRIFSDRQKEYNDSRANPLGRVPNDVWHEFPRVCGTYEERLGWHPCQMPEMVLARIIRACSNRNDIVLDPFSGSGTTVCVAKKLQRQYFGVELSSDYCKGIIKRLTSIKVCDEGIGTRKHPWPDSHKSELASLYVENGLPSDKLREKPELWVNFVQQFNQRMCNIGYLSGYSAEEIWKQLERLRKSGKLGRVKVHAPNVVKGHYPPPELSIFSDNKKGN